MRGGDEAARERHVEHRHLGLLEQMARLVEAQLEIETRRGAGEIFAEQPLQLASRNLHGAGKLGPAPPMVPMELRLVYSDGSGDVTYHFNALQHARFTPLITGVAISSIFVDLPHTKSHSHAHPEAYLYALEGDGYSEIGGKRYDWNQGDAIHVPPGMLHHQHFNPFDRDMKELRFEFGVRYWFVDQWKGYVTIDKHLKATTHMID